MGVNGGCDQRVDLGLEAAIGAKRQIWLKHYAKLAQIGQFTLLARLFSDMGPTMAELPFLIVRVNTEEGQKDYVTCVKAEQLSKGLISEAIMGVLLRPLTAGEKIGPAVFAQNRVFVDFMHEVIARSSAQLVELLDEAKRQGDGAVAIIDGRTKTPHGYVPNWDVVGTFDVNSGQLVSGSYKPNPAHVILSPDGFVQLDARVQSALLQEVANKR